MVMLRTHSELSIRDTWWSSQLALPYGLEIMVGTRKDQVSSIIPRGSYVFNSTNVGRIIKTRGELAIDRVIYHVEIVSMLKPNLTPLFIRLWNLEEEENLGTELLYGPNIAWFRQSFLGILADRSIIVNLIEEILGGDDKSDNIEGVLGIPSNHLTNIILTPNLSLEELEQVHEIGYHFYHSLIEEISDIFYPNDITIINLPYLVGIISGDLPRISLPAYKHPGTYMPHGENTSMLVETVDEYHAILRFALFHYDHFNIRLSFQPEEPLVAAVDQLDMMCGGNSPFTNKNLKNTIEIMCCEFVSNFFASKRFFNGVCNGVYFNGQEVKEVYILRTMDEYVKITIVTDTMLFEKNYDLVALSMMSPCLGMQPINLVTT